jgi:transcriptional regulator with XRE-family HTH domain
MTQQQLAERLGIPRSAIAEIETGVRCVSLREGVAIAAALDVPLLDLVSVEPLVLRTETLVD